MLWYLAKRMALNLDHLEKLMPEWKSLQPLEASREERLWQKLRLEWNYHSNHIEGNTLTYGETAAFLLHDQVSGTHSGREYDEMKGHDLAIKLVRDLAVSTQELTEVDVRNLNQIILKEPFYKEAITLDRKPSRKLIVPGRYKEDPNSVETSTGEFFEYAAPMDVPSRMTKLTEAIRNCTSKEGLTFMAALAITHHEFTLIHPFDDGNGRVARLLTNYVLLKKGLPPLVIPSEKKKDYLNALRQADGGDHALLADFFTDHLVWSLELGIKAAKGESLEEPSDIEKEIALFVRDQKNQSKKVLKKDASVVQEFLKTSAQLLFDKFDLKTKEIGQLFETRELNFTSNVRVRGTSWQVCLESVCIDQLVPQHVGLNLSLKGYRGNARHVFGLDQSILIQFHDYEYSISIFGQQIHHTIYAEPLISEKADEIVSDFLKKLLQQIKQQAQQ